MRAVFATNHGPADVLEILDMPVPEIDATSLLVRTCSMGLNFHDVVQRRGGYPGTGLPEPMGLEGAGIVEAVGHAVEEFDVGDRVAWASVPGSHAELVSVPAASAVPIPDVLSYDEAAAHIAQGLTAHYLAESVVDVAAGSTAVVCAAAGGVGLLLCQFLRHRDAQVVGVVSRAEKLAAVYAVGADEVCLPDEVGARLRELTGGPGADVVYDGNGADAFEVSLPLVRPRGALVVYGAAAGAVPLLDITKLATAGSVLLARPRLVDYLTPSSELRRRADAVFGGLVTGSLRPHPVHTYSLDSVADAHRALESRTVVGKILLKGIDR